jgi:hypothetical protein
MAYYFFNRFERENLPKLEKLASSLGLSEKPCAWKNARFWSGNVLEHKEEFYRELLVTYSPNSSCPLAIQTNLKDPYQKQTKSIIKQFIEIGKPTAIYREPFTQIKYCLKDFA